MTILPLRVILSVLIIASTVSAQDPAASGQSSAQTLIFNVEVLEFSTDLAKDIDKIVQERARLDRLIAEGKVRPVADVQVRARSGDSASVRVGQRVPVQTTPQNVAQTQYENTGLNLDISPILQADNQVLVSLKMDFSAVARSSGTTNPTFFQRSFNDRVRMKLNEKVILLSVVQQGSLWPSASGPQTSDASYGNFVMLLSARIGG